jgi:hypothetical protein
MTQPASIDSPLIAISYHPEDEEWRDRLVSHLAKAADKYGIWNDRLVEHSDVQMDEETRGALELTKVLVLLISPAYMESTWVISEEGFQTLRNLSGKGLRIYSITLQRTSFQQFPTWRALNVMQVNVTPFAEKNVNAQNSRFLEVANDIYWFLENEYGTRPGSGEAPLPTIADLSTFARSNEVEDALSRARRLATTSMLTRPMVTTACLLFGLAEAGRTTVDYFRTPQFLWKELNARGEGVYTSALIQEFPHLTRLGERAGRNIDSISAKADLLNPNVIEVFRIAEEVRQRTRLPGTRGISTAQSVTDESVTHPQIGARHLLAALLVLNPEDPTGAKQHLAEIIDVQSLRKRFYDFIVKSLPDDDDPQAWRSILIDLKLPQTSRTQQHTTPHFERSVPQPSVAGFIADHWTGRDLLGMTRDVNALASLVAAYQVEPPLSIGLFGDWGSGKSHFMRQMRKRVELLSRLSRESGKPQNKLGYYKNIVQIEFNAWHYIEGNLWASLVDHIFANLKLSEREDPGYAEQRRDELMQKLGVKEDIQRKINSRVQERENELGKLHEWKEQAEAELDKASTQLEGFREQTKSSLEKLTVPIAFTAEEKELLSRLGIDAGSGITAADVRRNYLKMKSGWNGIKARWKLFHADPRIKRRYLLSTLLAGIPIVGTLLVNFKGFPGIPTTVASVLGFAATLYIAAKPAWDQFKKSVRALEKHDEVVERKRLQRITQLESEVTVLTKEIVDAKLEGETVGKEVEKLKADIKNTSSSKILAEFIEDRAAASDYRRHLGLLALIRRDFEKLRDLFDQQRKEEVTGKEVGDEKKINRIVLYIDDLDRCPPDRVVQVLQAIHLLLAFPLFVVVVGVDSRWITRSLQESYEWLREEYEDEKKQAPDNPEVNARDGTGATPHDYLEKIFQIPLWLKSMNEDACVEFLDELTKEAVAATTNKDKSSDRGTTDSQQTEWTTEVIDPHGFKPTDTVPASAYFPAGKDENTVRVNVIRETWTSPTEAILEGVVADNKQKDKEIDLTPLSLTFSDKEIDYMKKLVPLIGRSPRAVKRFLNCYRLIKVGLTPAEFETFVDEEAESQSYKAAMILLGVITGTPTVSSHVIDELKIWCGATEFKFETFRNGLVSNDEMRKQPDAERLIRFFQTHDFGSPSDPLFKEMVNYGPRVSRFSFRVNRADTRHAPLALDSAIHA